MRWVAFPAGLLLLIVTLLDVFKTLVMPRAARGRFRLSRILFRPMWRPWRWVGLRMKSVEGRERVMAGAGPFFFFLLLVAWAALILVGFGLVLYSAPFFHGLHGHGETRFSTALYFSGSSLFTLGFGDVVATGWTRAVVIVEGATGLGLVAVVIGYLPVLYQAFNRREVGVLLLDARAGSPPSGAELLYRLGGAGAKSSLAELFEEWERWAADVLETHLSYPLLAFFRSPHDDTSWVTALGSVLDAATLMITAIESTGAAHTHAKLLYGTGSHAVEDLFYYFRLEERTSMIQFDEFEQVYQDIESFRAPVRPLDEAYKSFTDKRARYAGKLDALAVLMAAPPTQWIGDRSFLGARTAH